MRNYLIGISMVAILVVVIFACGPTFATIMAGQAATQQIKAYADSAVPADDGSSQITMTFNELRTLIQDQQLHDERMTDKVVAVSTSADISQTIMSIGGNIALAIGFAGAIGLFLLFAYLLFKGGRQ